MSTSASPRPLSVSRAVDLTKAIKKLCRTTVASDSEAEFKRMVERHRITEEEIQILAVELPRFGPWVRCRSLWPDRRDQLAVVEILQAQYEEDDDDLFGNASDIVGGIEDPVRRGQVLDRIVAGMSIDQALASDAVFDDRQRLANIIAWDYWSLGNCVNYVAEFPASQPAIQDSDDVRRGIAQAISDVITARGVADVAQMDRPELAELLSTMALPAVSPSGDKAQEKEMSDAQWLAACCSPCRDQLQDVAAFDRAAIIYRTSRLARAAFKTRARDLANKARSTGFDPFSELLRRLFYVASPGRRDICGTCHGKNVDSPDCAECRGCGFLLRHELPAVK